MLPWHQTLQVVVCVCEIEGEYSDRNKGWGSGTPGMCKSGEAFRDRQTGRQTDRQADRQTGRQRGRQTDRQPDRQTDRQTGACV